MLDFSHIELPIQAKALQEFLPHRFPMVMVDRVTALTENHITGLKLVSGSEPALQGHFPHQPIMPGVMMIEALAQLAGVYCFASINKRPSDGEMFLFAGIENARFKQQVIPADCLVLSAELMQSKRGLYRFNCTAKVDDKIVVTAEILLIHQFMTVV